MGFTVNGLDGFRAAFSRLRDKGAEKLSDATKEYVETVLFPRTQELVPEATGALRVTGEVRGGRRPGGWVVHYGNSPVNDRSMVDYAAAVHEILDHRHAPPTEVKFVQKPMHETVEKHKEIAGRALDELAQGY